MTWSDWSDFWVNAKAAEAAVGVAVVVAWAAGWCVVQAVHAWKNR